jgi:hypothetical protein
MFQCSAAELLLAGGPAAASCFLTVWQSRQQVVCSKMLIPGFNVHRVV